MQFAIGMLLQHANAKYGPRLQFAVQNELVVWLVAAPHCLMPLPMFHLLANLIIITIIISIKMA